MQELKTDFCYYKLVVCKKFEVGPRVLYIFYIEVSRVTLRRAKIHGIITCCELFYWLVGTHWAIINTKSKVKIPT